MDWDDLRHFLALSQSGTFLGAAKRLGVEHATISRRVASLERSLSCKLIDRRGRHIVLTPQGMAVAAHAARISAQTGAIEQIARTDTQEARGHVRISAPPTLSTALLAAPIVAIRRSHPGIQITLLGEKRFASLNRREADIAIRLSRPEKGDYTITKLGEMPFHLYASKRYIDTVPPVDWTFIGYDEEMSTSPQHQRLIEIAAGRPIALRSSVLEFQIAAAQCGAGIVMLPDFAVSEAADLQCLDDGPCLTREIWLLVHSEIKSTPAVRLVVEELKTISPRHRRP